MKEQLLKVMNSESRSGLRDSIESRSDEMLTSSLEPERSLGESDEGENKKD